MTINFEYHGVSASDRLETFIKDKLAKLFNKNPKIVATDVYLKVMKNSTEPNKMVTGIRLNVPKTTLFAESDADSFESATLESIEELDRQLRKYKAKLASY